MKEKTKPKLIWGTLLLSVISVLFSSGLFANEENKIDQTRGALEKWIETQRIISQEKRDLALAREMLKERIDLVKREIDSLKKKVSETEDSIAEADNKRAELIEDNEKLKEASSSLEILLVNLESRTKEMIQRLPDPIAQRIKPLSQRLPENVETTKMSTPERFQNIVGILNEIDKFNREVTVTSEVRTLRDGSSVEVTAMYIGIGQAYYSGSNGQIGGLGTPSELGWDWKQDDDTANIIADAIAILKNEKIAQFVKLPVIIE